MSVVKDQTIAVKILDRTYHIKCQSDAARELQLAASHVNVEMEKIRRAGKTNSTERVAVVAALNIAHELMQVKKQQNGSIDQIGDDIQALQQRIQHFLGGKDTSVV